MNLRLSMPDQSPITMDQSPIISGHTLQ